MKSTLIISSIAATLLASGFIRWGAATTPNSASSRTGVIRLQDLPLNRAVRAVIPVDHLMQQTCQFPATQGVAITEIGGPPSRENIGRTEPGRLRISVNGALTASIVFSLGAGGLGRYAFDPPLIVPPGALFTLDWTSNGTLLQGHDANEVTIAGWSLLPGDL